MEKIKLTKIINLEKKLFIRSMNQNKDVNGHISEEYIISLLNKYTLLRKALAKIIHEFKGGGKVMSIIVQINNALEGN